MSSTAVFLLLLSCTIINASNNVLLWPKPQQQTSNGLKFSLDDGTFQFRVTGAVSDILSRALDRYSKLVFYHGLGQHKRTYHQQDMDSKVLDILKIIPDFDRRLLAFFNGWTSMYRPAILH